MDLHASERKQRLREKRRAEGMKAYEVWLDPEGQHRLETLRQPGDSVDHVISRALVALDRMTRSVSSPGRHVPSHVPSPAPDVSSSDARARFIELWNQGFETKAIAQALGITPTAAQSHANKLQRRGLIQKRPRGGDYPSRRAQARTRHMTDS